MELWDGKLGPPFRHRSILICLAVSLITFVCFCLPRTSWQVVIWDLQSSTVAPRTPHQPLIITNEKMPKANCQRYDSCPIRKHTLRMTEQMRRRGLDIGLAAKGRIYMPCKAAHNSHVSICLNVYSPKTKRYWKFTKDVLGNSQVISRKRKQI